MPGEQTTSFSVLPDGSRVVIPTRGQASAAGLRVEVRGMVHCAYNNQVYDALYACDESGAGDTGRPHSYLQWKPHPPTLEQADVRAHRYVFRFGTIAAGVSPTIRVDIDRFVDDFLIAPSEVRRALSGGFDLTTLAAAAPAPPAWNIGIAAVPSLALVGGVAWVLHRRMTAVGLDYDLQVQLNRIRHKGSAAKRAVRPEDARLVPIVTRLGTLQTEARRLAMQIQKVRNAMVLHNPSALEQDIAAMERRITAGAEATEVQVQTLQTRKRALETLGELRQTAAQLESRLDRAEAAVESALAGLQSASVGASTPAARDTLYIALEAEVAALRETATASAEMLLVSRSHTD